MNDNGSLPLAHASQIHLATQSHMHAETYFHVTNGIWTYMLTLQSCNLLQAQSKKNNKNMMTDAKQYIQYILTIQSLDNVRPVSPNRRKTKPPGPLPNNTSTHQKQSFLSTPNSYKEQRKNTTTSDKQHHLKIQNLLSTQTSAKKTTRPITNNTT